MNAALGGARIVVTRPAGQADALCAAIAARGGNPLHLPLLEIDAHDPGDPARAALRSGAEFAIFTSPNAVRFLADHLPPAALAEKTSLVAIGPGTARALSEAGCNEVLMPPAGASSEALLDHPRLADMSGSRVLLIKGVGGRTLLADSLRARGAEVIAVEVYRREAADSAAALGRLLDSEGADAFVVTSVEALEHMAAMAGTERVAALRSAQLVVPSERVVKQAAALGFRPAPVVAADAGDTALLQALERWWRRADLDEEEA
jgi:uroporphyrinogen-III synthase